MGSSSHDEFVDNMTTCKSFCWLLDCNFDQVATCADFSIVFWWHVRGMHSLFNFFKVLRWWLHGLKCIDDTLSFQELHFTCFEAVVQRSHPCDCTLTDHGDPEGL